MGANPQPTRTEAPAFAPPTSHPLVPGLSIADPATDDSSWELQFRAAAIPASLLLATLIHHTALGPILLRNFFGMWLHELGHASAAWVCGRWALPVPWFTYASEERSVIITVAMLVGTGAGAWFFFRQQRWVFAVLCTVVTVLTVACSTLLKPEAVEVFGIFAGDAGAMVFGVLFMASFYAQRGSRLVQGAIRWGLVWWGAAALVDSWATWVAARRDYAEIPFGLEEVGGQGVLSDASKLVDTWGWSEKLLVNRYFTLGVVCLAVTAIIYAWGLWQQWQRRPAK